LSTLSPALDATGLRSRQRIGGLDHGKEFPGVASLLARTVARAFAAAEWDVVVDPGGRQVDHHHAGLAAALEMRGVLQRCGHDAGGKTEVGVVGYRKSFF